MKKVLISMGFAALALGATAQVKIKDGTVTSSTTPNSNAILELESNQRGLLYPRVALSSTSSASPLSAHIKGMVVYDTAYSPTSTPAATAVSPGLYYNDGTQWVRVVNSSASTNTAFIYGAGTPQTAGASCSSTAQNTIYTDTGSTSATLGQVWICDGTTWRTYNAPAATEWYLSGTATDAGASKTADIARTGRVGIGVTAPSSPLQVNGSLSLPVRTKNTISLVYNDTLTAADYMVLILPASGTAGVVNIAVPVANTVPGRIYKIVIGGTPSNAPGITIRDISSILVFQNSNSAQTTITLISDGVKWHYIQESGVMFIN